MTTSSGLSGRSLPPKPPAKGSFPLDHLSECRAFAKAYRLCLSGHARSATACRREARDYLECRMQRGLMAREDWGKLGLCEDDGAHSSASGTGGAPGLEVDGDGDGDGDVGAERAEMTGFVAGARAARRRRQRGDRQRDDGSAS